ncbi:MAG TPA: glycosyltransferase [Thermoanaerobaculia bacterium]
MKIVILGLSITSSWGNGHATTYRALVRALAARGHDVTFLERDVSWYASHRDLPAPPYCTTHLYTGLPDLTAKHAAAVKGADLVIVGSYVSEGVAVGEWVLETARGITAFYDIDTPVTVAKLAANDFEYLEPRLIPRYDIYLSFSGGPTLARIENEFGSPMARPLYCSFDPEQYFLEDRDIRWDLGYLGTYSDDRQPALERLLLEPSRRIESGRFIVAGPQYPSHIDWPANVERVDHLPPSEHKAFYGSQRFTLNVTRQEMIRAGWSPSVRLFEAAACGVPIISDWWPGLDDFLEPGREILIAHDSGEVVHYLSSIDDRERKRIGLQARERVLAHHTAMHRAIELERYVEEAAARTSAPADRTA